MHLGAVVDFAAQIDHLHDGKSPISAWCHGLVSRHDALDGKRPQRTDGHEQTARAKVTALHCSARSRLMELSQWEGRNKTHGTPMKSAARSAGQACEAPCSYP